MSKEAQQLWAITKIKGQEEEYRKAMEALNPNPIEQVKSAATSGRGMSFLVAVACIGAACLLNPQIPAQVMAFVDGLQRFGEVELPTNKGGR